MNTQTTKKAANGLVLGLLILFIYALSVPTSVEKQDDGIVWVNWFNTADCVKTDLYYNDRSGNFIPIYKCERDPRERNED